jgi:CRP/FNR family transcriptional regulator, dissimilatory nitrate respiration regulator
MHRLEGLTERLGHVRHFRHLASRDLAAIVGAGKLKRYRTGSFVFYEGEPAAGMYVLFSGKVNLCKLSPDGHEQIISTIEPVTMFNEITAIDCEPNPYSAIAAEACLTWNISPSTFENLVRNYPDPDIGFALMRVMASRTRQLIGRCEDLSFRPVLARTSKLLLHLSAQGREVVDRGQHPIKEMSGHIATVPEAISRSLGILRDQELIETTRQEIVILDPAALAAIAQLDPTLPIDDFGPPAGQPIGLRTPVPQT